MNTMNWITLLLAITGVAFAIAGIVKHTREYRAMLRGEVNEVTQYPWIVSPRIFVGLGMVLASLIVLVIDTILG